VLIMLTHTIFSYSNQYAICPSINDNRVYQGKLWGVNEMADSKIRLIFSW
jgi:hypothetical protein